MCVVPSIGSCVQEGPSEIICDVNIKLDRVLTGGSEAKLA